MSHLSFATASTAQSTASPSTEREAESGTEVAADAPWVAIVWNDPVNLMTYVTYVFQTLLGHPRPIAERLMLDVHEKGHATVANGTREAMEVVVTQLHAAGLWATMAQDK